MKLSRHQKGTLLAVVLLIAAVATALKVHSLLQSGEPVLWLAELWAPTAFLSYGLLTCLEFFLLPERVAIQSPSVNVRTRRQRR